MPQEQTWEKEYGESKLLTKENKPQSDVVRFVVWLKKIAKKQKEREQVKQLEKLETTTDIENSHVIDLGSGAGRNSFYFAELGASVTGLEISKTAIKIANEYKISKRQFDILDIKYLHQSIGEKFPCEDNFFDIAIDVTSSNSLTEAERGVYLAETRRVLKNGGYFFVKALCKDGDENAKYLLTHFPGNEQDTYIMPELGIIERVWSKTDFMTTYEKYFTILYIEKKTSYSRITTRGRSRSYKRNFWIVYMKK